MKNYSQHLTEKIADYNERFEAFLQNSADQFKAEAMTLFPEYEGFIFKLGREDIEATGDFRWGYNFRIYLNNSWSRKEDEPMQLKLSTSGSSYELDDEPDTRASYFILALQGIIAADFLRRGTFYQKVIAYFTERKAYETEYWGISQECEKETQVEKAKDRVEYMMTQFDELFQEGAIFAANESYAFSPRLLKKAIENPGQIDLFRIEKITNKLVKGGGGCYGALQRRAMPFDGGKATPFEECFWGEFWGGKKQIDKDYLVSSFVSGKLGFCTPLPFDHPVCQSSEN